MKGFKMPQIKYAKNYKKTMHGHDKKRSADEKEGLSSQLFSPPNPRKRRSVDGLSVREEKSAYEEDSQGEGKKSAHVVQRVAKPLQDINCRCYVKYWAKTLVEKIDLTASPDKKAGFAKTPFGHFWQLVDFPQHRCMIHELVSSWVCEKSGFELGGIVVPFREEDVCIITGLKRYGQTVKWDHNFQSDSYFRFVARENKTGNRLHLEGLLCQAASRGKLVDFVRLTILYLFSTVLFPTSSYFQPLLIASGIGH